ncbi:MAG: 2-dehydro-3-deoxy-6-phosphogalactonate aldolase [Lentisphaeria bacterium]|nr:2-dehydro-3-deoxy-6-phosphogalactonate aldolase [Lentisphaeria bacterium]
MKETFEKYMEECPAVAILRGITNDEVTTVCDVLYEAGIRLLEIPLNSPDAFKSIAIAAEHCKGRMAVGAGTVLTVEDVNGVRNANGTFIISPNTDVDVIRETKRLGMLSIPGFFTASEGFTAIKAGADYLKLFPAILGPGYVKDLKAVIKAPIMAVGGVNAGNIPEFLKVCCGVGIGSALYKAGKSIEDIRKDALEIVKSVKV